MLVYKDFGKRTRSLSSLSGLGKISGREKDSIITELVLHYETQVGG